MLFEITCFTVSAPPSPSPQASARQREAHLSAELASQEAEVAEERARAASLEEVVKGCNTAMQTAAHSRDEMEGLLELEQRGHAETELRLQVCVCV